MQALWILAQTSNPNTDLSFGRIFFQNAQFSHHIQVYVTISPMTLWLAAPSESTKKTTPPPGSAGTEFLNSLQRPKTKDQIKRLKRVLLQLHLLVYLVFVLFKAQVVLDYFLFCDCSSCCLLISSNSSSLMELRVPPRSVFHQTRASSLPQEDQRTQDRLRSGSHRFCDQKVWSFICIWDTCTI